MHCILFAVLVFVGTLALGSSQANALSCPSATIANPTDVLVVTYYVTASSCTTTNPGTGVLLSATIDDNDVSVTFSPGSTVVTSSVTTGSGCTFSITPPVSGNVAGYQFGNATTCSVSIALSDGGSLSFVADDALDGYANSFTSVNLTAGPLPSWTLTVVPSTASFTAAGQAIGYSYTVTNAGNVAINSITVSDTKVSGIACPVSTLSVGAATTCNGSYTTTAADVLAGSISGTAIAKGLFGAVPVASSPVTTTVQLDTNAVRRATQSAIRNFMNRRAEVVAAIQPDSSRKHQRLPGWLFGNGNEEQNDAPEGNTSVARGKTDAPSIDDRVGRRPGRGQPVAGDVGSDRTNRISMNPFGFNGSTDDDGGGRFAFATSLSKVRQAAESARASQEGKAEAPMGLGALQRAVDRNAGASSRLDFWAEGAMSYSSDTSTGLRRQGHAALLFLGVDYRIHPAILVGALVQFDWMSETTSAPGTNASGQGWMAGPYVSVRLTPNLFFDARAAWGTADNRVDPLGIYTDSFSTERSLVSAKLTGNWSYGQLRLRPSAEVVYFDETQKSYTNQINIFIPEQSIHLGRVSAGPEIGYQFRQHDGATFEPYVGVKGVWDFAKTADATVAGMAVGNDPFHMMLELGATYATPSGVFLRGSLAYDGIGDNDFRAYYGRGSLTVPLN